MAGPSPSAAGAPLALAIFVGVGVGAALHQPSAGLLAGAAVGTLIAVLVWLRDRRRIGR